MANVAHAAGDRDQHPPRAPLAERARAWLATHKRARVGLVVGALVVAAALVATWLYLRTFESTDDAQIDADISPISARVSGVVTGVHVEDNQVVHAGDALVELDVADYQVALAQAEANLAQAEAQAEAQTPSVPITETTSRTSIATARDEVATSAAELAAAKRDEDAARARLAQAEAGDKLVRVELDRGRRLFASGAVAKADLDQRQAAADAASAELAAARAALAAASQRIEQRTAGAAQSSSRLGEAEKNAPRQLDVQRAAVATREAQVRAARAALEQARLNLAYTRVVAPVDGIVGKKSVNVGEHVQPGQALFAIVQTGDVWVTANFKETQLARMHPGERARVKVDAFGATYDATLESLPGASGARYSLFPPENATGNFVKVVQRLPVRLRFVPGQAGLERLRPGMSVEPKVYVR